MKRIEAEMRPDWIEPYVFAAGDIPVVIESDHSRFVEGTRFDWGFVQVALRDGFTVEIKPLAERGKERSGK